MISYDKLWKKLIDKKMNRTDLKEAAGISFNVLARMGKNEPISFESIEKICSVLEYDYPETNECVFAMDQFIGIPELWNHGIGSEYVRLALRYLVEQKHADVVLLDPHKDNLRAVKAYEKAGFRIIGELPEHEMFEGEKVDCWLMEYRKLGVSQT